MNDTTITELAQNQFANAVRNFTPRLSAKFQTLLPFKDGIAELRRKGASYASIAEILRNTIVIVSHDTVARFCREVLELTPRSRRPRKAKNASMNKCAMQSSESDTTDPRVAHQEYARGPHIADPNTI